VSEQLPLQGPRKGECGCGCQAFGTLRVRPWRSNGVTCVTRGCVCRQCIGRRSKKGGQYDQQTKGARALTGKRGRTHEEHDRAVFRWQNKKTGKHGVSGPVHNAWDKVERDDEQLRPHGDIRPFLARFALEGRRYGLVVIRDDKLRETWEAIGIENGWLP
jgi:hypothetical protein